MFGTEKLDSSIYQTAKKLRIYLFISAQYMNVADTQTLHDGIGRAMRYVARQKVIKAFS